MDGDNNRMVQLLQITLFSITKSIWDFVGESSVALSLKIGDEFLSILQNEKNLQLTDANPSVIITKIIRIFQEDFNFGETIKVNQENNRFTIKVDHCINSVLTRRLAEAGVQKPFICPLLNVLLAAFRKLHIVARHDIRHDPTFTHSIIILEIV